MATPSSQVSQVVRTKTFIERWYFTGMAVTMIVVSLAGFMPSIVNPAGRPAPLTLLAAAHGAAFLGWLLLFLAQSLLVAKGRVGWHRRLGLTSVVLLALIIPLSLETSITILRRGYDLSGDSHISPHPIAAKGELDAPTDSAFNVFGLLEFTLLATTAIGFRRRPEVHKRLMLFAHMVHDFGEFTGETPTGSLNHLERVFGERLVKVRSAEHPEGADGISRVFF